MLEWLKGKKTYLAAAAMALGAVAAALGGEIDATTMIQRLIEAAGLAALRAGVAK